MVGTIAWWDVNRGWGFAKVEHHPDVFVHHAALLEERDLRPGDRISFSLREGYLGPVALRVSVVLPDLGVT